MQLKPYQVLCKVKVNRVIVLRLPNQKLFSIQGFVIKFDVALQLMQTVLTSKTLQ